jgi:hypothetical protein
MNIGRLVLQKRKEKKIVKKKWEQALAEYATMRDNNTVIIVNPRLLSMLW